MRPQDIVILLKIIVKGGLHWYKKDLARKLYLSQSEVSESLHRSYLAKLIDYHKTRVNRQNLIEFIQHGLPYVFPAEVGTMVKGIPTAHSHPSIKKEIPSELNYVWQDLEGTTRGLAIEPLYENQVKAAKEDDELYRLLALIDVLRVGKVREKRIAIQELESQIVHGS